MGRGTRNLSIGMRRSPCAELCRLDFHMADEHADRTAYFCEKLLKDYASRGPEDDQKGVLGLPAFICFTVVGRVCLHCDFFCVRSYRPSIFPSEIMDQPNARRCKGVRVSPEI